MHQTEHERFQHSHDFMHNFSRAEGRTRIVIGITVAMMLLEITAGIMSHSMALLADGWHMSTHADCFRDGSDRIPLHSSARERRAV